MTPVIHQRSAWTTIAPTGITRVYWPNIKIVDIHWPARAGKIARDRTSISRALRAWQRYHMTKDNPATTVKEGQGWRDIAYNVAVDLNGEVWILRGWDVQDGGVAGRSDDVTILLVMGNDDRMTDEMKRSVLWCMREFERRKGGQLRRIHHGALQSTSCPGPEATSWSRAGFPAPPPRSETSAPEEDIMATKDELRVIVREELRTMLNESLGMDWSKPAQGDSIRSAIQGVLHMRDVPDGRGRLDEVLGRVEEKLDELLATRVQTPPAPIGYEHRETL